MGETATMAAFTDIIDLRRSADDRWSVEVPDGWDFLGIPNGGLVSSILGAALVETVGRPDPITSTAHFLRPAMIGPGEVSVQIIRAGRRLTTARAILTQGEKVVAHLIASLGDLGDGDTERLPLRFDPRGSKRRPSPNDWASGSILPTSGSSPGRSMACLRSVDG